MVDIASPPALLLEVDELLDIFGFFLLVLIGLELLDTIKIYFEKGAIELKVIFSVALIAIGRKIIVLEPSDYDGTQLIGMAAIIVALVLRLRRCDRSLPPPRFLRRPVGYERRPCRWSG